MPTNALSLRISRNSQQSIPDRRSSAPAAYPLSRQVYAAAAAGDHRSVRSNTLAQTQWTHPHFYTSQASSAQKHSRALLLQAVTESNSRLTPQTASVHTTQDKKQSGRGLCFPGHGPLLQRDTQNNWVHALFHTVLTAFQCNVPAVLHTPTDAHSTPLLPSLFRTIARGTVRTVQQCVGWCLCLCASTTT